MGITLCFKTAGVANFAQGITATVGAFLAAWLLMRQGLDPWLSGIAGIAACFLIGWSIDFLIVSRMKSGPVGRIMVTLGLIIIITSIIPMAFGMIPYDYVRYFAGLIEFTLFGENFTIIRNGLFVFLTAAGVVGSIFILLHTTKWGLKVRATASNPVVASMMGINTKRLTALSWGISGACASLAAVLLASQTTIVNIAMLDVVGSNSLLALIVGGYTSFFAPIVGAVIIPVLVAMLAMVNTLWANVMMYSVIMLLILIRPMGLFGKKTMDKI
jgi:branched-chain amino acid transport system permease protein